MLLDAKPEELPTDCRLCEDPTTICTRRTGCAGVLMSASSAGAAAPALCILSSTSPARLSGLLVVEVDSDLLNRLVCTGATLGVLLSRTTRLRGGGLLSLARAGEVCLEGAIPPAVLLVLVWRRVSLSGRSGSGAGAGADSLSSTADEEFLVR